MIVDYSLGGLGVTPVNRDGISIQVIHDEQAILEQNKPQVAINGVFFALEDVEKFRQFLLTSPGITEGVPFNMLIREGGITETFEMYADMMNNIRISNDGVEVSIKALQSRDWLQDKSDGFTFESLWNETNVTPFTIDGVTYNDYQTFMKSKMVFIPYVISSVPNWRDAFIGMFGVYYVANELVRVAKQIGQWLTPSTGFGLVMHVVQLIAEILYLTLLLLALLQLLIQLFNTLVQPTKFYGAMLLSDLFKVTAAKLGMEAQSSIWNSHPFNKLAYIPEKFNQVESPGTSFSLFDLGSTNGFGTKGYTTPDASKQRGYFNGVGGDLLRLLKSFCNGKYFIPNGTNQLYLERRDFAQPNSPYKLDPVYQAWNGYNTDELIATTIIKFLPDLNEKNCIDHTSPSGDPFYTGTVMQITHEQNVVVNQKLVLLKNLREIQLAVARGVNKDSLTFIEQLIKDIEPMWNVGAAGLIAAANAFIITLDVVITAINLVIAIWNLLMHVIVAVINAVEDVISFLSLGTVTIPHIDTSAGQLGMIPPIPTIPFNALNARNFTDRINALLVENDILSVPKVVMINTDLATNPAWASRKGFLHPDNPKIVNAKYLFDAFYHIDAFFDPVNPSNTVNRFTKISPALNHSGDGNPITLSLADWKKLVNNSSFIDHWNEPCVADSIQWFPEQNGRAEIQYRKPGWLSQPQHPNPVTRNTEININLKLKTSLPDGQ